MELRSPEGGALMPIPQDAAYFTNMGRKKLTLLPKQDNGGFSPCPATAQPMRNQHIQPIRSHGHPELSISSNGLLLITAAPNFLLFLYKITLASFVFWTCLWFTIVCMSCLQFLCYSQINSFLLVK